MFVSELGPNEKGNIAEMVIAAEATKLGIPVYRPMTEHGRTDLVLEIAGRLWRVQCKWGRLIRDGTVISVTTESSYFSPGSGYVRTKYVRTEIDLLAVYCGELDRCYLLPLEFVADRRAVWLRLEGPPERPASMY